ncbi:MAG: hypothetical protein H7834_03100 [Magnetococcus sp. YQC-9]
MTDCDGLARQSPTLKAFSHAALFLGHVRGIVLQKAQNNPASLGGARRIFLEKARKMLLVKKRAQVKVKTLGEESPRPSLFF